MREILKRYRKITKFAVTYVAVATLFLGFPPETFAQASISADIKANGEDGTVTVVEGEEWSYSWTSEGATACQLQSPSGTSGITLAGNDGPIGSSHSWYPEVNDSVTLTLNCTDGVNTDTDEVTIEVIASDDDDDDDNPPADDDEEVLADIKIRGRDGVITIVDGENWGYRWTSSSATACQLESPSGTSGITLAGSDGPITPDHSWYPEVGDSTTLTLECTNGVDTATDSATVRVVAGEDDDDDNPPADDDEDVLADIKANGQDGTVTIQDGDNWSYSWTSESATACQLESPSGTSGITLAGNDGPITPDHSWYPEVGDSTTLTLECTNGVDTDTDSVTIVVTADDDDNGGGGDDDDIEADIKINGQDGLVTIQNGDNWSYSWTSESATACQLESPSGTSGITLAGNDGPITPDHSWYPDLNETTTLTLECTDGVNTAVDSASVRVVEDDDDNGGGGGGGGGGGRRRDRAEAEVLGVTIDNGNFCPFITSYMRIGQANDTMQVIKLQAFLRTVEGHTNVQITGVFDEATRQAVNAFQLKYASDVLTPWGISQPTGYVYLLTARKINEIVCGPQPLISVPQVKEIKGSMISKESTPVSKEGGKAGSAKTGGSASSTPYVGTIGETDGGVTVSNSKGQNGEKGIAGALFATPGSFAELMQCLYIYLLILVVLYVLGTVLENVLYKNVPENARKRFIAKWATITAGLVIALIAAYLLGELCVTLPLLITLIACAAWMFLYPKRDTIRTQAKIYWTKTTETTTPSGDQVVVTESGTKK